MKNLKKLASLILALVMVFSLATTAFAAEADLTGHTYKAYQIFTGTQADGKDELGQVDWGTGINSTAFLAALKADATIGSIFTDCTTAAQVAEAMKGWGDKSANAKAFAAIAYDNKAGEGIACENGETSLDAGYYLVVDVTVFDENAENAVHNTALLQLTNKGTFEIANKTDVPEVDKVIVDGDSEVEASTVEIGEKISFKFTGKMPTNIDDYDTYYYVFTDTMSNGLTYAGNLKVTVNGKDVTTYFWSNSAEKLNSQGATLKVGIQDILALEKLATVGNITSTTEVVVTYDALVNEDASVGVNGETNKVKLEYSNDPNNDGDGATEPPSENPNEPKPTTPVGKTPEDTVKVYTTAIQITKIDKETQAKLTGAKFQISGVSSKVKVVNSEMYVPYGADEAAVEGNVWYMLKDGTYTQTAPVLVDDESTTEVNEKTSDSYDDVNKTYKQVETVNTTTVEEDFVAEGWVKSDGTLTFTGLGEGTYTITELVAPNGYNKLTTPITVVISSGITGETAINDGAETITWSATVNGADATIDSGVVKFDVENTSGSTLPETGGMGTTLFYIVGGLMVMAAVVLLVTKKRMAAAE